MRILKVLFDFYLDASIHVALAVVSLYLVSVENLNTSFSFSLFGFIFFATIVCYNFVKYGVEAEKYLIVPNAYQKKIQVFSFLSFALAVIFASQLTLELWLAIIILGIVAALYAVPFLPSAKNLRSLGGLKIYVVAAVWTGFTVGLPALDAKVPFSWDLGIIGLQRLILVLVLMLPFEIRDLKWDHPELRTIPQVIGVDSTLKLGMILSILLFLLTFFKDEVENQEIISRAFLTFVLILIFASKGKLQKDYFVSFWVESIPILWLLFYWGADLFA